MSTNQQESEFGESEAMLCISCLHPNDPDAKYCRNCGAPIGSTSAWGPWEQTQAEGFILRQATTGRPKFIILLGIWILFFPAFIGFSFLVFLYLRSTNWSITDKLFLVAFIFIWLVSGAILYRGTLNYFTKRHGQSSGDD